MRRCGSPRAATIKPAAKPATSTLVSTSIASQANVKRKSSDSRSSRPSPFDRLLAHPSHPRGPTQQVGEPREPTAATQTTRPPSAVRPARDGTSRSGTAAIVAIRRPSPEPSAAARQRLVVRPRQASVGRSRPTLSRAAAPTPRRGGHRTRAPSAMPMGTARRPPARRRSRHGGGLRAAGGRATERGCRPSSSPPRSPRCRETRCRTPTP